jgi:hypothetical protein
VASIGLIKRPAGAEQDWVRPALSIADQLPVPFAYLQAAGTGYVEVSIVLLSIMAHGSSTVLLLS